MNNVRGHIYAAVHNTMRSHKKMKWKQYDPFAHWIADARVLREMRDRLNSIRLVTTMVPLKSLWIMNDPLLALQQSRSTTRTL